MAQSMSTCKKGQSCDGSGATQCVPFFCPVEVTVLPDGPAVQGHSFDISLGGVGITLGALLEPGQPVQHLVSATARLRKVRRRNRLGASRQLRFGRDPQSRWNRVPGRNKPIAPIAIVDNGRKFVGQRRPGRQVRLSRTQAALCPGSQTPGHPQMGPWARTSSGYSRDRECGSGNRRKAMSSVRARRSV